MAPNRATHDCRRPDTITMRFDTTLPVRLRDAYAARHEPEAQRVLARVVWAFCTTLFCVSLCVSVAYGAWEFSRMPRGEGESAVRAQTGFTREQIESLLETFDARAEEFDARLRAPALRDPS